MIHGNSKIICNIQPFKDTSLNIYKGKSITQSIQIEKNNWFGIGAGGIKGTQGRYFLPMLPLMLLALKSNRINVRIDNTVIYLVRISIFSFLEVVYSIVMTYILN